MHLLGNLTTNRLKTKLNALIIIAYSQTEYSPKDATQNCAHYPTEKYTTYDDCYGDYIKQTLNDLVPFWITQNLSESTSFYTFNQSNIEASKFYANMGKQEILIINKI